MALTIVCDSACDLDSDTVHNRIVVPLSVAFGTDVYDDGVTITREAFYDMMAHADTLPTTSQPSPAVFSKVFEEQTALGNDCVVITVSAELSGTYASALQAAKPFPNVWVVDSAQVTVGERALVLRAQQLADQGMDAQTLVQALEAEKNSIYLLGLLDTLDNLRKGGRIPKAAATIGEFLRVKPVVGVENGKLCLLGQARGSKNGRNMLRRLVRAAGVDAKRPVCVTHTGSSRQLVDAYLDDSRDLWEELLGYRPESLLAGATIGTHAGPGAIAVAFFTKPEVSF